MRKISLIIIHCSANRGDCKLRSKDIDRIHRMRGWNGCGYHYVITTDGQIETGRSILKPGAHCRGHNQHSIGVCYIGGLSEDGQKPEDTRNVLQRKAMKQLLELLHKQFPEAIIVGHHDLNPQKACPCFDVVTEYSYLQPK